GCRTRHRGGSEGSAVRSRRAKDPPRRQLDCKEEDLSLRLPAEWPEVGETASPVLHCGTKWVKVGDSSDRTGMAGLLPLRHPRPGKDSRRAGVEVSRETVACRFSGSTS